MELDVLHLNCLPPCRSSRRLKHDFVIQPKPQFWHSGEVAFQLYGAKDLGAQDVASGRDEKIQGFDDVKEDLVLAIADPFATPGDGIGDGDWGTGLDFEFVGFLRYVSAVFVPLVSAVTQTFLHTRPCFDVATSQTHSCNILLSVVCG